MKLLKSSQKKKLQKKLKEQYGIEKLPYTLLKFGKEKIRLFSGNLTPNELILLDKNFRIENAGLYFIKEQKEELRLSIDSLSLFKGQITQNLVKINQEQLIQWFKGEDLELNSGKGFKVLRFNNHLVGCGKSTGDKILNFVPKEKRIR